MWIGPEREKLNGRPSKNRMAFFARAVRWRSFYRGSLMYVFPGYYYGEVRSEGQIDEVKDIFYE